MLDRKVKQADAAVSTNQQRANTRRALLGEVVRPALVQRQGPIATPIADEVGALGAAGERLILPEVGREIGQYLKGKEVSVGSLKNFLKDKGVL